MEQKRQAPIAVADTTSPNCSYSGTENGKNKYTYQRNSKGGTIAVPMTQQMKAVPCILQSNSRF